MPSSPWGCKESDTTERLHFHFPSLESLFLPVLWKSCSQILLGFKIRLPGHSQSLCRALRLENLRLWVPNLHNSGRISFVLLLSSLWVTHCWVWDLILSWLCPSYHLALASSLSLDMGYLFLVGSSILLSMVVQQLVVILCSQRRRWVHILLLHHLKLEVLP